MIFICESIPSSTNFFITMMFNHSNTEFMISYESVMDSLELFLFAFLLQLFSRKISFVSRLFTISISIGSSLLDNILRDWKEVHRLIDEFLIGHSFFMQKMPARATDNADIPVWMTYDSLNQNMNVKVLRSVSPSHREYRRCWNQCSRRPSQSWTYPHHHDFWDDNLLALCAIFPLHQVSLIHRDFGLVVLPFSRASPIYRKNWALLATYTTISWVTGCPVRSSMGLGVGLEEPNWSVSPSDCWTILRHWSMFNDHFLYSNWDRCFKEIFGGGRRDKYCLSLQFLSISQSFSFYNAMGWKLFLEE